MKPNPKRVGSYEAKTRLPSLLAEAVRPFPTSSEVYNGPADLLAIRLSMS